MTNKWNSDNKMKKQQKSTATLDFKCSVTWIFCLAVCLMMNLGWIPLSHGIELTHLKTSKQVILKENTRIDLDVMPDLGVRLIFPFLLDEPALEPAFFYKITNGQVFKIPPIAELKGQNSLIVNVAPPASITLQTAKNYIATLYMSVNGYNVTLNLRLTLNAKRHTTDLIFDLSHQARQHLIDKVVERKTAALEKEYKRRYARIDEIAKEHALKHLHIAVQRPKITRYKETQPILLPGGVRMDLYVDQLHEFRSGFYLLTYEVINRSPKEIHINSTILTATKDDVPSTIDGANKCSKLLRADMALKCVFITQDAGILDTQKLDLTLSTDRGVATISW